MNHRVVKISYKKAALEQLRASRDQMNAFIELVESGAVIAVAPNEKGWFRFSAAAEATDES